MKAMTDKEKAKRYDALQVAIRAYLDSYQKDIERPLPDYIKKSDCLRHWEEGNRAAKENFIEILGRWLG